MKLTEDEALSRLTAHNHGVLSTLNIDRGVDAVPVVYAVTDGLVGIPVDQVKPKSSTKLQRETNLIADPRASLLIEHWDPDDWSKLWWVRAQLRYDKGVGNKQTKMLASHLAESFSQYRDKPFASMLVLRIETTSGWSAADS